MLSHPQVIRQILYVYVDIHGYCYCYLTTRL